MLRVSALAPDKISHRLFDPLLNGSGEWPPQQTEDRSRKAGFGADMPVIRYPALVLAWMTVQLDRRSKRSFVDSAQGLR